MAGRWRDPHWALSALSVPLMMGTVSGARGTSTGLHITPLFAASGVNQTPMADVSILAGSWGRLPAAMCQALVLDGPWAMQGMMEAEISALVESARQADEEVHM